MRKLSHTDNKVISAFTCYYTYMYLIYICIYIYLCVYGEAPVNMMNLFTGSR